MDKRRATSETMERARSEAAKWLAVNENKPQVPPTAPATAKSQPPPQN